MQVARNDFVRKAACKRDDFSTRFERTKRLMRAMILISASHYWVLVLMRATAIFGTFFVQLASVSKSDSILRREMV